MSFTHTSKVITKRFYYLDKTYSEYSQRYNGLYNINRDYPNCNDSFKSVRGDGWLKCPHCDLLPKEWAFNNGWFTQCGCYINQYFYFCISATPLMHQTVPLNHHLLRDNWNDWVTTGNRDNVASNESVVRTLVENNERVTKLVDKDILGDDFDESIYQSLLD